MKRSGHLCLVLLFVLIGSISAWAQISPGKLARPHASLEGLTNCTQCHVLGDEVTNEKCLACHSAIQSRIERGRGFHSSAEVKGQRCAACHTDHQGVEFELVNWKPKRESFDHEKAGWPLLGAHKKLDCMACHKPALITDHSLGKESKTNVLKTMLGLGTDCNQCHQDEHRGQLGTNCASCHHNDAWVPAPTFVHDKAKFPLAGKHRDVTCEKCHQPQPAMPFANSALVNKKTNTDFFAKYTGLTFANCTPCHNDPHENKFGQNCKECHTVAGWGQIVGNKFDHALTKYPLAGKHRDLDCQKCHTSGNMTEHLSFAHCTDCHKDQHRGQFADRADKGACESCHSVEGYKPANFTTEAHGKSRYALTGSHLAVACFECHKAVDSGSKSSYIRYDFSDLSCKGCHADRHGGQAEQWMKEKGCERCHTTDTWHTATFDHNLSKFPLAGKHNAVTCAKCHVNDETVKPAVVKLKNLPLECAACHRDVHESQFLRAELNESRTDCKRCHTPDGWKQLSFDHTRDTRFALDGAHAKVTCAECHKPSVRADGTTFTAYRPLGRECADCHGAQQLSPKP